MPSFKAAVLVKKGAPLEIVELKIPKPKENQILVRNIYSGVCRSQLMEQDGSRGFDKWIPHLLGHEGFGVVLEIGKGVSKVKVGDSIILSWIKGSGTISDNPQFKTTKNQVINSGKVTTFSEVTITSECFVTKAPKGFDEKFYPLFGCALLTGAGMAIRALENNHKKIVIIGFGGVGSAAAIALSCNSELEIVIVEDSPSRRSLAVDLGFLKVLNSSEVLNQIESFDLCLESAGTTDSIELGFKLICARGKLVFASHPPTGNFIKIDPYELIKGKKIEGSWGGGSNLDYDVHEIANLLLKSNVNLNLLIGNTYKLSQINEAIDDLRQGLPGRPIISFVENVRSYESQ